MVPPNENPARTSGGVREKSDLADEADRTKPKLELSDPQTPYLDLAADTPPLPEQELALNHLGWGQPSQRQLDWLLDQGVTWNALIRPLPIGACRVFFQGRTFKPDSSGVPALTFSVIDCGEVMDIAAWQPRSGDLASWQGQAFCLGDQNDLFNPAIYFGGGALRIHASPLDWLRANREGIVILRPDLVYAHLRNVRRLSFADATHARRVQSWLEPPPARAEFFIETPAEMVK